MFGVDCDRGGSVPSRRRLFGSAEFCFAAENPPKNAAAENAAEF